MTTDHHLNWNDTLHIGVVRVRIVAIGNMGNISVQVEAPAGVRVETGRERAEREALERKGGAA